MKCDYCEGTDDVHTLTDRELGPDIHICRPCWERGEEARLITCLNLTPVQTPFRNRFPRKHFEISTDSFRQGMNMNTEESMLAAGGQKPGGKPTEAAQTTKREMEQCLNELARAREDFHAFRYRGYTARQLDEMIDRSHDIDAIRNERRITWRDACKIRALPLELNREIAHVQLIEEENTGDLRGCSTLDFSAEILDQLLFLNLYDIEAMAVEDGKLKLTVRYTGPAMNLDTQRAVCWDTQQHTATSGAAMLHVVGLPKE